jgi:hypothetical protein
LCRYSEQPEVWDFCSGIVGLIKKTGIDTVCQGSKIGDSAI